MTQLVELASLTQRTIYPGLRHAPVYLSEVLEQPRFVEQPLNVLFLCDTSHPAGAVQDHIDALVRHSRHHFYTLNPLLNQGVYGLEPSHFDAILIHYSIYTLGRTYLSASMEEFVSRYRGPKAQFIQDEYRSISYITAKLTQLGTHVLFSSLEPHNIATVYASQPNLIAYTTLPGMVTQHLAQRAVPPVRERPLHAAYRTHELPFWLGRHGQLKPRLAREFPLVAERYGLKVDISDRNSDRVYGENWIRLLTSAKSALGTEGGASIFDFDGVEDRTRAFLANNPDVDFKTVFEHVLAPYEGNVVHTTMTPRIFESIALRTPLVLIPGCYRHVVQPYKHYLPLEADMSNAGEVAEALKDDRLLQEMADRAYEEIALSDEYSWPRFARQFDRALDRAFALLAKDPMLANSVALPSNRLPGREKVAIDRAIDQCRYLNNERAALAKWPRHVPPKESDFLRELYRRHPTEDLLLGKEARPFGDQRARILFLCNMQTGRGASGNLSIHHIRTLSHHHIDVVDMLTRLPSTVDVDAYDVIVVHWTLVLSRNNYIDRESRARIARAKALKIVFIQDEYRFVERTKAGLRTIGADVLFTSVPQAEWEKVYSAPELPGLRRVQVLTGYVPPGLPRRTVPDVADRPIDVGYRGRDLPAWLGELGQEKMRIGRRFEEDAPAYGLTTDICWREGDRIYGEDWLAFITRCKAMLGVESGANVFDFTGRIQENVESHLKIEPTATFEKLRNLYFPNEEGRVRLNQISPRVFECLALKTLLILYEGEYSGIVQPWRHFVPLKKDHSNMEEVVNVLRDHASVREITERGYREIALNPDYQYDAYVRKFDTVVDEELAKRRPRL